MFEGSEPPERPGSSQTTPNGPKPPLNNLEGALYLEIVSLKPTLPPTMQLTLHLLLWRRSSLHPNTGMEPSGGAGPKPANLPGSLEGDLWQAEGPSTSCGISLRSSSPRGLRCLAGSSCHWVRGGTFFKGLAEYSGACKGTVR